jgi:hypothetical protein
MDDHEDHEQDSARPPPAAVACIDTVTAAFEKGGAVGEDGVDDAFTVVHEISEQV